MSRDIDRYSCDNVSGIANPVQEEEESAEINTKESDTESRRIVRHGKTWWRIRNFWYHCEGTHKENARRESLYLRYVFVQRSM